jgi:hypothetical protein
MDEGTQCKINKGSKKNRFVIGQSANSSSRSRHDFFHCIGPYLGNAQKRLRYHLETYTFGKVPIISIAVSKKFAFIDQGGF